MKRILITILLLLTIMVLGSGTVLADRDDLIAADAKYLNDYTIAGPVNYFNGVDPADKNGNINVIVEIPSGTTGKWEISPDTGNIAWEFRKGKPRTNTYRGGYPVNYGTSPKTILPESLGGEGESIDVILFGIQRKRGEIVKAKLIGVLKVQEGDGAFDDKLLAVALGSPEYAANNIAELDAKFDNIGSRTKSWFEGYKGADSGLKIRGIGTPDEAKRLFYAAMKMFRDTK